jgi:poly-gamma-glutamate synthesis protein (capsule biosynthesis protein)
MYFPSIDLTSGNLLELDMMPLQMRRFQLVHASSEDTDLLVETLDQESRKFGTRIVRRPDSRLALSWSHDQVERCVESALHE